MPPAPSNHVDEDEQQPEASSSQPKAEKLEVTINTKPVEPSSTEGKEDPPQLKRNDLKDSWYKDNTEFVRRGAPRPVDVYDEFVSPPRPPRRTRRAPPPPDYWADPMPEPTQPLLMSSVDLLQQLNYDGLADLPILNGQYHRSSIYLSTFPFTDKDVKQWSWLFQLGIEGKFLFKQGELPDDDGDVEDEWLYSGERHGRIAVRSTPYHRGRHDRSPWGPPDNGADVPSVYLSRALDPAIVPEPSEKDFTFVIVVRNRGRAGGGAKLLTAGSRKAAGILIYYEGLIGHSVAFVGAVKEGFEKGKKAWKYKRVESVEEAEKVVEEGIVGVVC
ncbi:uncharacterized protein N0V89_011537 [Didymosphaeria variabile]|uniref:Uncharacterized protein n=1 Tax=Didymosphaeria variabile TaxID=1932322 RepID=A0A9W9C5E7_9PLEO|nr:uncharacterized protein N0V89_011537 [Didymosphaeria variabile]KAJ4345407.1 hypothetical protein N0V89_011537 [Didymosphaeria variabile]